MIDFMLEIFIFYSKLVNIDSFVCIVVISEGIEVNWLSFIIVGVEG